MCSRQSSQPVSFHRSAITHAFVSLAIGIVAGVGLALTAYFLSHFPMLKAVLPVTAGAGGLTALVGYVALRLLLGKSQRAFAGQGEGVKTSDNPQPPQAKSPKDMTVREYTSSGERERQQIRTDLVLIDGAEPKMNQINKKWNKFEELTLHDLRRLNFETDSKARLEAFSLRGPNSHFVELLSDEQLGLLIIKPVKKQSIVN